jgi:hypothetical protein
MNPFDRTLAILGPNTFDGGVQSSMVKLLLQTGSTAYALEISPPSYTSAPAEVLRRLKVIGGESHAHKYLSQLLNSAVEHEARK